MSDVSLFPDPAARIVAFGECMLELGGALNGPARLGYGGDALNTALYLRRLGLRTSFATALGLDPWSRDLRSAWAEEGLDLSLVLIDPDRTPGLYAIRTDAQGERSFAYWRETSAARNFMGLPDTDRALEGLARADLLYLSGISLSLLDAAGRERIREAAETVRARGGDVAFDPNYRAKNWPSRTVARDAIDRFAGAVTIALPTFGDEANLQGDVSPEATAARWLAHGVRDIVVKMGASGAMVCAQGRCRLVSPAEVVAPVDTTGAGDSFNAAYLSGHVRGLAPSDSAALGNQLAGEVIRHAGAIIPIAAMPTLNPLNGRGEV